MIKYRFDYTLSPRLHTKNKAHAFTKPKPTNVSGANMLSIAFPLERAKKTEKTASTAAKAFKRPTNQNHEQTVALEIDLDQSGSAGIFSNITRIFFRGSL